MSNVVNVRNRKWFLTINSSSECYNIINDILTKIENFRYIFIYHNVGTDKEHIHLCLVYENARTFESVRKLFVGAHIEGMKDLSLSVQYLLHLNDKDKEQLNPKDLISNDLEFFNFYLYSYEYEVLDTENIIKYYKELDNIVDYLNVFGVYQCNKYLNIIKEMIKYKNNII